MKKINALAILGLIVLGACGPRNLAPAPMALPMDPAAAAAPVVDGNAAIAGRVLQQINTLRGNIGLSPLQPSPALEAASLVHSRDMSAQNRAWHWGSDGSSPLDRAQRQGFGGELIGENISETYENEIETLAAWMSTRDTRDVIMDPTATQLGFAWFKEPSGKVWWTLLTGR
ncbi:CAP domain-containing protein [Paracoccus marcusii]|uniref:CAP domain-containing protein n=1 Tax=Paracoccus marcusii TaxID=59779 RepID=A0ABY7UWJ0_9RHOB|nr:CAP domain-containing protein [Paracoccus marcusii]WDA13973.1 CAP domain-containing protein [Paracoccus marcusii]